MNFLSRVMWGVPVSLFAGSLIATVQCGTNSTGSLDNGDASSGSGSSSGTASSGGEDSSTGSSSDSSTSSSGSSSSSSGSSTSSSGSSTSGSGSGSGSSTSSSGVASSGGTVDSGPAEAGSSSSSSSSSSSGGPATVSQVFGITNNFNASVANSFVLFPCLKQNPENCVTDLSCPNEGKASTWVEGTGLLTSSGQAIGFQSHEYFQLGGTPGTNYLATLAVNGVSEGKGYLGGKRAAGNAIPVDNPNGLDMFYTGGTPNQPTTDEANYNIYELIVWNPPASGTFQPPSGTYPGAAAPAGSLGSKVQNYFLNSFPDEGGADITKSFDNTYAVAYTHQIVVPGGAILEYATQDANCLAVDNCGPPGTANHNVACGPSTTSIYIPNDPKALSLPQSYIGQTTSQVNTVTGASQPYHSQMFHITVTAITACSGACPTPN